MRALSSLCSVLLCVVAACAHANSSSATSPGTAAGPPPLPPSSGTPIGILLDEASALHLRTEQIAQLREIDQSLAARNEKLDSELRPQQAHDPTTTSPNPMRPRVGGHRRGGGGGAGPANHPPQGPDAGAQSRATDERSANTRDAVERALALLDDAQRTTARALLRDHGVELAPAATAATAPASPDGDGDDEN